MRRFLKHFNDDQSGATAVVFGISFLVLCLSVGLAYDSSRLNNVTTRVQNALDAAALAGARLIEQDGIKDDQIISTAKSFFDARRPEINMNGLEIGDIETIPNRAQSSVLVKVNGSLTSLFGGLSGLSPTLNFTRQSETVFKTKKIELSLVLDITGSMSNGGKIDSLKTAAKDLIDTLFATNPVPGAIRVSLVPYSAAVNAGAYKPAVTNAIGGEQCVVERGGSDTSTDVSVSGGNDLGTSSTIQNPQYFCPTASVEPLTDLWDKAKRTAFKARIDALSPNGGTAGHIGLSWGWYFLSPNWAYLWPAAQRPKPTSPDVVKAIILMTDGEFNTSYLPSNKNSVDFAAAGSSGDQTLASCQNIKDPATGITIFTIGFQAPANAEAMLRACSGDSNFFDANNTSDLITAFREIAERLTSLRISS